MLKKFINAAENAFVSGIGLVVGFITALMGLFEALRPNLTRGRRAQLRHRTYGLKTLPYWSKFNGPIYVPEHDREVIQLLISGNVTELVAVLERGASLGSGWAAGLLGHLEAAGVLSGKPDLAAAIARCRVAAQAGDPYAQFVLAWALWETGERAQGMRWMRRAGIDNKFLPAWASLGVMLYILAGTDPDARRTAVKVLWSAHRRGHAAALGVLCRAACGGHFGIARRLLGLLAYPLVLARSSVIVRWHPFSERSFVWYPPSAHPILPFFKSEKRGVASPLICQSSSDVDVAPQPVGPQHQRQVESRVPAHPEDHG